MATFSRAVSDGTRLKAWKTKPTVRWRYVLIAVPLSFSTDVPATRTVPSVGRRIPPRTDSNEVFPHPEGPSSTTSSPALASRSRPSIGRTE